MNHRTRFLHTLLTLLLLVLFAVSGVRPGAASPAESGLFERPTIYVLQKGEFPYCIARRFNVDPKQLLSINHLISDQIFYPGLTLSIPLDMRPFPGSRALRAHTAYTIRSGDTIGKIACWFGDVDPAEILSINGLSDASNLPVGQVLTIPAESADMAAAAGEGEAGAAALPSATPTTVKQAPPAPTATLQPTPETPSTATPEPQTGVGQEKPIQPPAALPSITATIDMSDFIPKPSPTPIFRNTGKPNIFEVVGQMLQGLWQSIFPPRQKP